MLLSRRGLQVALGALWVIDGLLQAEPAKFARGYPLGDLAQSAMGQPAAVSHSIFSAITPFVAHWPLWNLAAVLLQLAIGAALVSRRLVRPALAVSVGWALVIWWVGEGFGTLPTGFAAMLGGAPGPALLYAVLAVLAWPRAGRPSVAPGAWAAVWTVLWLGSAGLRLGFGFPAGQVIQANLEENALGQPGFLHQASAWLAQLAGGHGLGVSIALATVQVAVGLGGLGRRHRRWWLGLAVAFSLFAWVVGQSLGGVLSPDGTDPGLGPLVVLLALTAWPVKPSPSSPVGVGVGVGGRRQGAAPALPAAVDR